MSCFKLIEKLRDPSKNFSYDLLKGDEVLIRDIKYSQGMKFVYENIKHGDFFQEIYLDGKSSDLLSFDDMLNSFGMKSFLKNKMK